VVKLAGVAATPKRVRRRVERLAAPTADPALT
jgi:hypothetical protein